MLRCPNYPRQSRESCNPNPNLNDIFSGNRKKSENSYGIARDSEQPKRTKLEDSTSLNRNILQSYILHMKTVWYWHKDKCRPMEWNRESVNKCSHIWSNDLQQGVKSTRWGKNNVFNDWDWENWPSIQERINLGSYLIPHTIIESKWIKDSKLNSSKKTFGKT